MEKREKKSLLQKFEIPLNHLDFEYIKNCRDAREMEKIVRILRSGEEGYFPDLTRCAEEKLQQLKPNSRLFRHEEELKHLRNLDEGEKKTYFNWWREVRDYDQELKAAPENDETLIAPVRERIGRISKDKETSNPEGDVKGNEIVKQKALSATDYRKWDLYDPDEEIVRMELAEERVKEEIERKNRLNNEKSHPLIVELKKDDERLQSLTQIERKQLSEEYRLHGNEFYKDKEYEQAYAEYTRAIEIYPSGSAAAYNNRAMTDLKLGNYQAAIDDCQSCLKREPKNMKAYLRLADAHFRLGKLREALDIYEKILDLDASNATALSNVKSIRLTLFGDENDDGKAPEKATRLVIKEEGSKVIKSNESHKKESEVNKDASKVVTKTEKSLEKAMAKALLSDCADNNKKSIKDYDLAELVKPNYVTKSKLAKAAEVFGNLKSPTPNATGAKQCENPSKEQLSTIRTRPQADNLEEETNLDLLLTSNTKMKSRSGAPLIQEI